MLTYKGRACTTSAAVCDAATTKDDGLASGAYAATTKAKIAYDKLALLETAVGKCTPTNSSAWLGGACTAQADPATQAGAVTGLVKFALRKKLAVDDIATSKATRETYLDAYCRAAQTLGAVTGAITGGTEYYARANPGVRTDYLFTAAISGSSNLTSDTYYRGANGWTFETLGDVLDHTAYRAGANNGSAESPVAAPSTD
jgi:hypothetical protein